MFFLFPLFLIIFILFSSSISTPPLLRVIFPHNPLWSPLFLFFFPPLPSCPSSQNYLTSFLIFKFHLPHSPSLPYYRCNFTLVFSSLPLSPSSLLSQITWEFHNTQGYISFYSFLFPSLPLILLLFLYFSNIWSHSSSYSFSLRSSSSSFYSLISPSPLLLPHPSFFFRFFFLFLLLFYIPFPHFHLLFSSLPFFPHFTENCIIVKATPFHMGELCL